MAGSAPPSCPRLSLPFSEQLVMESGELMASSALSTDAVQNHLYHFLEMNHHRTPLPWDRENWFKSFREDFHIVPSLIFVKKNREEIKREEGKRAKCDLQAADFCHLTMVKCHRANCYFTALFPGLRATGVVWAPKEIERPKKVPQMSKNALKFASFYTRTPTPIITAALLFLISTTMTK